MVEFSKILKYSYGIYLQNIHNYNVYRKKNNTENNGNVLIKNAPY